MIIKSKFSPSTRVVVILISKYIDAKDHYKALYNDSHSFFESRKEAAEDLAKVENQLCEALEKILKR